MKKQTGRSMIEMIGVLAIIGVLSVVVLKGFSLAMARHFSNTIIDYATKCGIAIQTKSDGSFDIPSVSCSNITALGEPLPSNVYSINVAHKAHGDTNVQINFEQKSKITHAMAALLSVEDEINFCFTPEYKLWISGVCSLPTVPEP